MKSKVLCCGVLMLAACSTSCSGKSGQYIVKQTEIDRLPKAREMEKVSEDGRHIAYVVKQEGGYCVVRDGRPDPTFQTVGRPVFSPDGNHLAYPVSRDRKRTIVLDGKPLAWFKDAYRPTFSPDGTRLVFVGSDARGYFVVQDGKPGPECLSIGEMLFSPDSKRLAYVGRVWGGWVVVVDGKPGVKYPIAGFDNVKSTLVFSPNSRRLAHSVLRFFPEDAKIETAIVCDGTPRWRHPDTLRQLLFSPDSSRLACLTLASDVIVDGRPDPRFGNVTERTFRFSRTGRRLTYMTTLNGAYHVVIDGKSVLEYDPVRTGAIAVSPNCERVAYVKRLGFLEERVELVVDGKPGPEYEDIANYRAPPTGDQICFSPNGKRLAYTAKRGGKWHVVVDRRRGPGYAGCWGIRFTQDSRHVSYTARQGARYLNVVDGSPGPLCDIVNPAVFSSDGKHVAYEARCYRPGDEAEKREQFVVLDGEPGPRFDQILSEEPAFDSNGGLEYLAQTADRVYRVKHVLRKE